MEEQKIKITYLDPKDLIPYANHSKTHPEEQIEKLAYQIATFGFDQPIVVDKNKVIIKGHARRQAALKLGLDKVPVIIADHLDTYQAMAARIADNKIAEYNTSYDFDLLALDLKTLIKNNLINS